MRHIIFVLIAVALVNLPTSESCRVLCIRQGYDGGKVAKRGCVCATYFPDYDNFIHNRIDLRDLKQINRDDQDRR